MNLVEVSLSSLIVCLATSASLGIWSLAITNAARQDRKDQHLERLSTELHAVESQLRRQAESGPVASNCAVATTWLARWLSQQPQTKELSRQVKPIAKGEMLMVLVGSGAQPEARQRLFSPSAMGLCLPKQLQEGDDGAAA